MSAVSVLLGGGTRYLSHLDTAPIDLEGPIAVARKEVTRLYYAVSR